MNIFDIIGPIMVGPSSSHTAGALQIGYIARIVLRQTPVSAKIKFYGSFAGTYKGHGSDKAVIGGLLGYRQDDGRISTSLEDATALGMDFSFQTENNPDMHPNTIEIQAKTADGVTATLVGVSIGGGNVILKSLDGIEIDYTGKLETIIVKQVDTLGVVSSISGLLATKGINISSMRLFQTKKEQGNAITIIETEDGLSDDIAIAIRGLDNIINSIYLPKIS